MFLGSGKVILLFVFCLVIVVYIIYGEGFFVEFRFELRCEVSL